MGKPEETAQRSTAFRAIPTVQRKLSTSAVLRFAFRFHSLRDAMRTLQKGERNPSNACLRRGRSDKTKSRAQPTAKHSLLHARGKAKLVQEGLSVLASCNFPRNDKNSHRPPLRNKRTAQLLNSLQGIRRRSRLQRTDCQDTGAVFLNTCKKTPPQKRRPKASAPATQTAHTQTYRSFNASSASSSGKREGNANSALQNHQRQVVTGVPSRGNPLARRGGAVAFEIRIFHLRRNFPYPQMTSQYTRRRMQVQTPFSFAGKRER